MLSIELSLEFEMKIRYKYIILHNSEAKKKKIENQNIAYTVIIKLNYTFCYSMILM